MIDIWTWDNFQTVFTSESYHWAISHDDLHDSNIMINNDDWSDLVLLDWEWSSYTNPGIDLASWTSQYSSEDYLANENSWLETYYLALRDENPDITSTYMFETLKADYLSYGTAMIVVRNLGHIHIDSSSDKRAIS